MRRKWKKKKSEECTEKKQKSKKEKQERAEQRVEFLRQKGKAKALHNQRLSTVMAKHGIPAEYVSIFDLIHLNHLNYRSSPTYLMAITFVICRIQMLTSRV